MALVIVVSAQLVGFVCTCDNVQANPCDQGPSRDPGQMEQRVFPVYSNVSILKASSITK